MKLSGRSSPGLWSSWPATGGFRASGLRGFGASGVWEFGGFGVLGVGGLELGNELPAFGFRVLAWGFRV